MITGVIGAAGLFIWHNFKDKFVANASEYLKENFSIQVAGVKIHKVGLTGLELRINADLINLSPIQVIVDNLKAYVFYVNNGKNNHLATTTINNKFTIASKDTSRISDIKISVPYASILQNMGLLNAVNRQFKIVVSANVNGTNLQFSNNITA